MQLLQKLLNKFNGLYYNQEYLCLAKEDFSNPIHAYWIQNDRVIKEITGDHVFIGYHPLIFSISSQVIDLPIAPANITLLFTQQIHQPNGSFKKKDALALLSLHMIKQQAAGDLSIYHYKGIVGHHNFLSGFHQFIARLYNRLYNKKLGNVYLEGNLYTQVQIAYSVPRNISLITTGNNGLYNLFPTDLHGSVAERYYVSSLRKGGKACEQVEKYKRIVISEIHAATYKNVYALGKNHMQELKERGNLPFSDFLSGHFQLPLPQQALFVRELEVMDSFTHGIHQLFLYRIVGVQQANNDPETLAHIHNSYATWRQHAGIPSNYLMR